MRCQSLSIMSITHFPRYILESTLASSFTRAPFSPLLKSTTFIPLTVHEHPLEIMLVTFIYLFLNILESSQSFSSPFNIVQRKLSIQPVLATLLSLPVRQRLLAFNTSLTTRNFTPFINSQRNRVAVYNTGFHFLALPS